MVWVKIDDQIAHHPKFIKAGPVAAWLWVCGNAYCNKYLTDGFIDAEHLHAVSRVTNSKKWAERLVDVGLWDRVEGGFQVHDFHDFNPSAEEVRSRRTKDRLRKESARSPNGHHAESAERPSLAPAPARAPVPSRPVPLKEKEQAPPKSAAQPTGPAFERYQVLFVRKYGGKPTIGGEKDGGRMARLLRSVGLDETLARFDAFFESADPWIQNSGHTLDVFFASGTQTKLVAQIGRPAQRRVDSGSTCHHSPRCGSTTACVERTIREGRETQRGNARESDRG